MQTTNQKSVEKENKAFWKDISIFGLGLMSLFFFNLLGQQYFFRWDLTEEKRYTISDATKAMLRSLDEEVEVTVYLEGEINPGFQRLQKSVEETLEEFEVYAGNELTYRFVNPLDAVAPEERQAFFVQLAGMGIEPTRVYDEEDGQRMQKLIVPGAIIKHQGQEAGVMLLNGNRAAGAQEALNQSIENVEYELASGIRRLVAAERKTVGFLTRHGELQGVELASLRKTVSEFYDVNDINLSQVSSVPDVEVLMINKPKERFSREDKYKLDQYIMQGGKIMFFIDPLFIEMDSIGENGSIAFPYDLNLDDMLFRYGLRINKTLVQDIKSGVYPFVVGDMGGQPQIVPLQWPFFPIVNRYGDHPIVKNMDAMYLQFASEIDTVLAEGVKKTPLVFTSEYSRVLQTPIVVDLMELREAPRPENFNAGPQAVAYLLEGEFTSVFKNRVLPNNANTSSFQESSVPTKMIVVADGELVRNEVDPESGEPLPLSFDPITERSFANEDFIINALSYLTDEDGLINARAKEIQIRPLDQVKVKQEATMWQMLNLLLPILLIVLFGLGKAYLRRRRYARH
jgi:gliding-associated putative ABC transporter substrate-binding component GldG